MEVLVVNHVRLSVVSVLRLGPAAVPPHAPPPMSIDLSIQVQLGCQGREFHCVHPYAASSCRDWGGGRREGEWGRLHRWMLCRVWLDPPLRLTQCKGGGPSLTLCSGHAALAWQVARHV